MVPFFWFFVFAHAFRPSCPAIEHVDQASRFVATWPTILSVANTNISIENAKKIMTFSTNYWKQTATKSFRRNPPLTWIYLQTARVGIALSHNDKISVSKLPLSADTFVCKWIWLPKLHETKNCYSRRQILRFTFSVLRMSASRLSPESVHSLTVDLSYVMPYCLVKTSYCANYINPNDKNTLCG